MFGSQVLEVVIGLILVYLVLSIGCSGIKEIIAAIFSLRAKTLEDAIRNMLKDGAVDYTSLLFKHPLIAASAPEGQRPSYLAARSFALALLDVIAPPSAGQPRSPSSTRAAIAQISDEKLRNTLLGFFDTAQGDIDAFRNLLEHWFDDTMERISGWYKRMSQKIIFGAGLALCLALNADSLMVVKELWSDQALAKAVVAQAENRIKTPLPSDRSNKPVQPSGIAQVENPAKASAPTDDSTEPVKLSDVISEVRDANSPPIGWSNTPKDIRCLPQEPWSIVFKILGIFLTSFAITLGAPFWFDLLNKVFNMNARLSGHPPAAAN